MGIETLVTKKYTCSMSKKPRREAAPVTGLLTVKQVADRKGLSTTAIYNAIGEGKLHVQKIGELQVLSEWEVDRWQPQPRGPQPKRRRRPVDKGAADAA